MRRTISIRGSEPTRRTRGWALVVHGFVIPAGLAFVLLAATGVAAVSRTPVIATRLNERQPAASESYLAWQQNSAGHPKHYDLYVLPIGGEKFKVNAAGTEGVTGAIDGTTLVFQQYRYNESRSDLKLFDLVAKTTSNPPTGVNTKKWEYWPRLSGDWLLFGRHDVQSGNDDIVLFNLVTGEAQTLAHTSGWKRELDPGQISGDFAVWAKGTRTAWDVFVYDIGAGTTTQVPNPNHKYQWGSSVTATGTVYYGRSAAGCGSSSGLMSYPLGGPATKVVSLARGSDFVSSYAVTNSDASTSVYYDPGVCGQDSDIVKVTVP